MENIKNLLKEHGFAFELINNDKPIYTAKEGADYFKINIGQTAATLIIYTDIGFYALVVSGERGGVNFKEVKHILNCKDVRLATKDEVKEVTGFSIGRIPLFGISLPYIIDTKFFRFSYIYGGTGELNVTLKVTPDALTKLNQVVGMLE
ncbi:aminoacyl-tRNA deacylase [Tepidibacter aestuarii]|uniref:aminoacyl-tRNA deacylase n=1 Tax=Tepidibacter aestuarii TaxID=2925782 RepID=UPI0020BE734F|nr:YbaK/EbsC family protein [Tepidibacter aestuarii]CAH2214880.1 tRNA_edit domain-containing protein [Tepidibacter aestuarii]